mmetsp:Transcript_9615/g.22802  ORF Transcript_9615/g.22802 Transcript_9615/m.22802 type:complete len:206 (+) Transcript_9615:24-641(+)
MRTWRVRVERAELLSEARESGLRGREGHGVVLRGFQRLVVHHRRDQRSQRHHLERGSVALEDLGHRRIRVCDPYSVEGAVDKLAPRAHGEEAVGDVAADAYCASLAQELTALQHGAAGEDDVVDEYDASPSRVALQHHHIVLAVFEHLRTHHLREPWEVLSEALGGLLVRERDQRSLCVLPSALLQDRVQPLPRIGAGRAVSAEI